MEDYKDILDLLGSLMWIIAIYYALVAAAFVFWIIMLVDVARRVYPKQSDKTRWLLIVVILGVFGALWYYFSVKKKPADSTGFPPPNPSSGAEEGL